MNRRRKVFQDTVHGYISVPEEYCDNFIDTIEFQRLRRIEQTSMRCLYPSARHDRFIHSIGTFYLGSKIFQHIKHNSYILLEEKVNAALWDKMQYTFEIACLLHDCGHAPFSHTFEKYYDRPPNLHDTLISISNDEAFISDLCSQADPAQHEMVSSYLVLTIFSDKIKSLEVDPVLVARMILGCLFIEDETNFAKFANCFIQLLKGKVIDVDRLDYVIRDKWASGFSSNTINIERLLSSACIKESNNHFINCYKKNALSEIQSVIDIKNFQNFWIFNHHKVLYDQFILEKAINKLVDKFCTSLDKEKTISEIFNIDTFTSKKTINGHSIYLLSDDDLVHLLKSNISENEYSEEWLSRNHKLIPVWKSFAEYNRLFLEFTDDALNEDGILFKETKKVVKSFLKKYEENEDNYLVLTARPKIKSIGPNEINIVINDKIVDYCNFKLYSKNENNNKFFFYLYIPKKLKDYIHELEDKLLKLSIIK